MKLSFLKIPLPSYQIFERQIQWLASISSHVALSQWKTHGWEIFQLHIHRHHHWTRRGKTKVSLKSSYSIPWQMIVPARITCVQGSEALDMCHYHKRDDNKTTSRRDQHAQFPVTYTFSFSKTLYAHWSLSLKRKKKEVWTWTYSSILPGTLKWIT